MNDEQKQTAIDSLALSVSRITGSLNALSTLKLAEEFYSQEERQDFYARLSACQSQEKEANEAAAGADDNARNNLYRARDAAITRANELRREHPLLARLYLLKTVVAS